MGRVTHFEIHADDPQRAMGFYRELLGWKFEAWGGMDYWLADTGPTEDPGIHGAILRRETPVDGRGIIAFVCTADVAELDPALAAVPGLGGNVVRGKRAVPGIGWHAYVQDTEGNLLGLMQADESAE